MDVVTTGAQAVAKDVVTGAIGSLISKLGELLKEKYKLQKSARDKVESLVKELECAQAALRKVAEVPPDQLEENVEIWAREVRDASYDMEDEIETFLVHVDHQHQEHSTGQESFFQRLLDTVRGLIKMPSKRRKISGAIDDINKRLEDITRRHGRYTVVDSISVARPASVDPRLAAMYKEVTELVGIEKSSSELIAMLLPLKSQAVTSSSSHDDETKIKMVSVVGVGGLGKTTLAKAVYDKLKVDFECSAFVPVGRNPDLKKVFQDILREIDKEEYKKHTLYYKEANEQQLIDELRETFLGNKRYLLVIDDVWEITSWETIKLALVQKSNGSRVITTTRILEVAKQAGEEYKLQQLPYDKSKKLFYTRIFGAEGKCPDNQLDEVSDKFLKKCDGVPLAIITMASMLVGKSREEWIEVCSSIAFRDKDNKQVSDTEWILSLSYYDLPPHLKTCLLYLSVFSEDHAIRNDSLIWMWLAEGFVHNDKLETWLFEIGNGYFNELINRSMIQVVESDKDDDMVVGCRVHDMVLDLLRFKSHEENFVTVSSSNNAESTSSPSRVRRLTHQNQNEMVDHTQMDLGHVRSFIACRCAIGDGFSFRSFKLLRVLALDHCSVFRHRNLENLLHLRYLRLGYSYIHEIPEEIGALKFLQTLDLEGANVVNRRLPSSIGLLKQLICLRAMRMTAPKGVIEKLTSLEQLEIRACGDTVGHFVELGKLCELRVLYAELDDRHLSMERDLVESLGNLHKIRRLIVPCIFFSGLPSCISPSGLPNLTHLNLTVYDMEDQHLEILGQLPELRHLKLHIESPDNTAKVTVARTADGCFQKLISLVLPYSAVMFVINEDSGVSFNVGKTLYFSTEKRDKCIVAPVVLMPNLEVLEFKVYLYSEVNYGICDNLGLDCLPSLQRVKVEFWCLFRYADVGRVKAAAAALRQAIEGHPKRPMLQTHIVQLY